MTTSQALRPLRFVGAATAVALALGLAACGERVDDRAVGQRTDSAAERAERATANANNEARQAGNTVGDKASNMGHTVEAKVDDVTITASVNADLARDPDLSAIKINVDTKDGVVTLSGPAPTEAAKERATTIATNVKGVAGVNNHLQVQAG